MTREQLIEAAATKAQTMGWQVLDQADTGREVELLLGAEGATEQVVSAPLSKLRRELSDLGGPELYPAVEEYDVIPEPALVEQDGSWTEEAERLASPGELPAGPDGEDAPEVEPHEEAKEVVEMDVSLKELWRALTGQVTDQDQGGIPHPQQQVVAVRTSSVFRVQGLNPKARTHVSSVFASGIYRDLVKAKRGYDGAVTAGLQQVRVVRLAA